MWYVMYKWDQSTEQWVYYGGGSADNTQIAASSTKERGWWLVVPTNHKGLPDSQMAPSIYSVVMEPRIIRIPPSL
jgi:hypothetical protein